MSGAGDVKWVRLYNKEFAAPRSASLARLLWIHGWLHWPPRTVLVERALEALDVKRGEAA